jgi:hypothetical protein
MLELMYGVGINLNRGCTTPIKLAMIGEGGE